jgi:hypothetical protein
MPSYILCKLGFQKSYIQRIRDETPSEWHIVETWQPVNVATVHPRILFIVSGSPTQQKEQMLRIRFGGGSAAGAFTIRLSDFRVFLAECQQRGSKNQTQLS